MKLLTKKRYEELQKELTNNEIEICDLNKRLNLKISKIYGLEREKEYLEEQIKSFANIRQELYEKVKKYKDLLRKANGAKGGFKRENNKLNNELDIIIKKQEQSLKVNDDLRKDNKELINENSELKEKLEIVNDEKSKLQSAIIQLNEKIKVLTSKKNAKKYLRREERKNNNESNKRKFKKNN